MLARGLDDVVDGNAVGLQGTPKVLAGAADSAYVPSSFKQRESYFMNQKMPVKVV